MIILKLLKIFLALVQSLIQKETADKKKTKRRLRLRRAAKKKLRKITKSKDIIRGKSNIIHTLILPITTYNSESCTVKRTDRKKNKKKKSKRFLYPEASLLGKKTKEVL